jgi:hypothetical protein
VFLADLCPKLPLLLLEVFRIAAKRPHRPSRQAAVLTDDLFANLVKRLATQVHDMETVETDLGIGEVLAGTRDERLGHVHGDFLHLRGVHTAPIEFGDKLRECLLVLA